ncbi:hypothetical protein KKA33_01135, partial [Patescibacteria group bacterium]|nr:hypothetical protein [Patescibacteria group bacterium]
SADASQKTSGVPASIDDNASNLYIGGKENTSGNLDTLLDGYIDEVRIYDRALSADQITLMYNAGRPNCQNIAYAETSIGDVWSAEVTIGEGDSEDSVPIESNDAEILGFSTAPYEYPASTSTSPTDAGDDVTIKATANVEGSSQWYLAVCKTNAVTAGDDTAPTCDGGAWDVSDATTDQTEATATYTTSSSDSESNVWYAFACDKVSGGGTCSSVNQGSGDSGSPFAVNHAPAFGALAITDNTLTPDELLTDGDMEASGTTSWAGGNGAVLTKETTDPHGGSQVIRIAYNGVNYPYCAQNSLTIDKEYRITGWARGDGTVVPRLYKAGGGYFWQGTSSTDWQYFDVIFTANHTAVFLLGTAVAAGYVEFDDVSVFEVGTIEPGDTLRFTLLQEQMTETDADGTQDTVSMYVCSDATTSFNYSTNSCTGGSLICSDTAVDPATTDATCDESGNNLVPTGTSAGDYNVKVYVEDSHDLAGTGTNQQSYTVENTAPAFTAGPTDSSSSSTTPTDAGDDVTFTATATDDNGDDYYLLVCDNNSAPTTGTPPECNGGSGNRWALSSATTSGDPVSSVTYTTQVSDSTSNDWYAFACDADSCSSADQGSGDGGSPFEVNHRPEFSASFATSDTTATGSELLTDGDMEAAGTTAWLPQNNPTYTKETGTPHGGSQVLRVAYNDTASASVRQNVLTAGNTYKFTGWARSDGTGTPRVQTGYGHIVWTGTTSTSWQEVDVTGVSESTGFYLVNGGSAGYSEFDDMSVVEAGSTTEPGEQLLYKFQTTDSDTDIITVVVCDNSGFNDTTRACIGEELCRKNLAATNPSGYGSCLESDSDPNDGDTNPVYIGIPQVHDVDGTYANAPAVNKYTVHAFDSHYFTDDSTTNTPEEQFVTVTDVAPVIGSYGMTDTLSIAAGGYDTYDYTAVISDDNGEADIVGVAGWLYDDTAIDLTAGECTEDENDCYKDSDDCSLNTSYGTNVEVEATCSMNVWFNANASTAWKGHVNPADETTTVTDGSDSSGQTNSALQGITVSNVSSIAYGTVALGEVSVRKETAMGNVGNQGIDVYITGMDMTCTAGGCGSNIIGKAQQKWYHSDVDFNWNDAATDPGPYILVGSNGDTTGVGGCANRNIPVRDAHASTANDESVWWKLKIPDTQASGEYAGTNTFTTTADDTCTGTQY